MAELVGDKRKLNCKSIVERYKIHKEVERGTSCGAAVRKYVFAKKSLFNWKARFLQPSRAVTWCVVTIKYYRCIYICNHILLKKQHIFKQKNMKILLLFLPKNPDKWDIFKVPLIWGSLKWEPR